MPEKMRQRAYDDIAQTVQISDMTSEELASRSGYPVKAIQKFARVAEEKGLLVRQWINRKLVYKWVGDANKKRQGD